MNHPITESLDFVPTTKEIFSTGFRQEQLIKKGYLKPKDYFEIGQKLAKIHMLKIDGLTNSNQCSRNTDQIYNHLKMSTTEWLFRCAIYDGNRNLEYHEILNRIKNFDEIIKETSFENLSFEI